MDRVLSGIPTLGSMERDCQLTVIAGSIINYHQFEGSAGSYVHVLRWGLGFHLGNSTSNFAYIDDVYGGEGSKVSTVDMLSRCYQDLELRYSIKPFIGQKFSDLDMMQISKYFPGIEFSEGPDGFPVLKGKNDLNLTLPQLLSKWLTCLSELAGMKEQTCIGIPGYFTDLQRRIVLAAAKEAGFSDVVLVHETTATALTYPMETKIFENEINYFSFIDMGVTSMQVSVVRFSKGQMKVLSHAFDKSLGGRAFDELLINYFLNNFREEKKIDMTNDSNLYLQLYDACEKMKIELSTCHETSFRIHWNNKELIGSMTREEFERMSDPLLKQVTGPLEKALSDAGLCVNEINLVVTDGCASRIPGIIKMLAEYFRKDPIHVDEYVPLGLGGGIHWGALRYLSRENSFQVDIFPHPIAMSWSMKNGTIQGQIVSFPKGSCMGIIKEFQFSGPANFFLNFMYADDLSDLEIHPVIARFQIDDPFKQSTDGISKKQSTDAKVSGVFKVRLDLNGVVHVESASIYKKGKMVELQVSRMNELQEVKENPSETISQKANWNLSGIYKTIFTKKPIRTELKAEKEKKSKLEELDGCLRTDELEELENPRESLEDELKEIKSLLAIEKEKSTEIKDEPSKFKREASDKSLHHERTTNELLNVSKKLKEIKSLLEIEAEKSKRLDDELANARMEFGKQKKFLEEESNKHQQANIDLQGAFVEVSL